ncbi:MAG: DUF503 domain-containing protein [Actinomycetota bacterium]
MYVGTLRIDFIVPGSASLKDKRKVMRSMIDSLRSRFNASIAEVDFMDLRQRGAVGIVCVSNESFHARKMLEEIERSIRSRYDIEIVEANFDIISSE